MKFTPTITAKCPSCGCNGRSYTHLITGKHMVSCEADDANYHDLDHVEDWCPGEVETAWFNTEAEAIEAWNKGNVTRYDQ